mgnify:CR=1 FL=1
MFGDTHTHTHYHYHGDEEIKHLLKKILMNQTELAAELEAVKIQSQKTNAEINRKLVELQTAIEAQGNVSPEVEAKLAELKAVTQANDDLIVDEPTTEEPTA